MQTIIQTKISDYQVWRNHLTTTITSYRNWLTKSGTNQAIQELRIYDVLDSLKKDQLVLAFVAEFSRGKTETINALFFADLNCRLLPSEPGRATMCPTEIYWDDREEPCIKLLPIETRNSDDTLNYFKNMPNVWQKIRLNTESALDMKDTLVELMRQKPVSQSEAKKLGLWSDHDSGMMQELLHTGLVNVPVWRHAIINYPHPLLKNGLVVIDTPGLNALGAEPELTLSIIPNAHAVLFLTATDTGVTKSDMQIWNNYINRFNNHKIALLNKIDVLWDEIRSDQEIEAQIAKQIAATAQLLGIKPEQVFAISAQKALLAKIKKDASLLKRSGIEALEFVLAESMINSKQSIIAKTVVAECSEMIKVSRKLTQKQWVESKQLLDELKSLLDEHDGMFKILLAKVLSDRKRYEASIPTFNKADEKIMFIGGKLLRHLSLAYLDKSIEKNRLDIHQSWTTIGLNQAMRGLTKQTSELAEYVAKESAVIKKLADNIYDVFQNKHHFDVFRPPVLSMTSFLSNMQALEQVTKDFCADPINLLTEKHFLIRKFYLGLYAEAQKIFQQAYVESEIWLKDVMSILKTQMANHKANLDHRVKTLSEAQMSASELKTKIMASEETCAGLMQECNTLDALLKELVSAVKTNSLADKEALILDETPFLDNIKAKESIILDTSNLETLKIDATKLDDTAFQKTIMLNMPID